MQELIQKFVSHRRVVEVWLTSCIVTSPPPTDVLIVPANERLCGTEFTYFPVPKSSLNCYPPRLNFLFSDRLCRRSKLIILVETKNFYYFFF